MIATITRERPDWRHQHRHKLVADRQDRRNCCGPGSSTVLYARTNAGFRPPSATPAASEATTRADPGNAPATNTDLPRLQSRRGRPLKVIRDLLVRVALFAEDPHTLAQLRHFRASLDWSRHPRILSSVGDRAGWPIPAPAEFATVSKLVELLQLGARLPGTSRPRGTAHRGLDPPRTAARPRRGRPSADPRGGRGGVGERSQTFPYPLSERIRADKSAVGNLSQRHGRCVPPRTVIFRDARGTHRPARFEDRSHRTV